MIWFLLFVVIVLGFVISKSGPIEKPKSTIERKEVEFNLKEYPEEYKFSVSGVHLPQYSYPVFNICKELDVVMLVPEPDNHFDSDAIKVEVSGWQIGYVPAGETNNVHDIIKKDHFAYIENREIVGYITVQIKIRYKDE